MLPSMLHHTGMFCARRDQGQGESTQDVLIPSRLSRRQSSPLRGAYSFESDRSDMGCGRPTTLRSPMSASVPVSFSQTEHSVESRCAPVACRRPMSSTFRAAYTFETDNIDESSSAPTALRRQMSSSLLGAYAFGADESDDNHNVSTALKSSISSTFLGAFAYPAENQDGASAVPTVRLETSSERSSAATASQLTDVHIEKEDSTPRMQGRPPIPLSTRNAYIFHAGNRDESCAVPNKSLEISPDVYAGKKEATSSRATASEESSFKSNVVVSTSFETILEVSSAVKPLQMPDWSIEKDGSIPSTTVSSDASDGSVSASSKSLSTYRSVTCDSDDTHHSIAPPSQVCLPVQVPCQKKGWQLVHQEALQLQQDILAFSRLRPSKVNLKIGERVATAEQSEGSGSDRLVVAREACACARGLGHRLGSELSSLDNEMSSLTEDLKVLKRLAAPWEGKGK